MINYRHTGIYVNDLGKQTNFYMKTFNMIPICLNNSEHNDMLDDLFKIENVEILTTKLITELGKQKGIGDMIELIKVISFQQELCIDNSIVYANGVMHFAIAVDDIEKTCSLVTQNGGQLMTDIHIIDNKNKCSFVRDPEGNWIEIIQNIR